MQKNEEYGKLYDRLNVIGNNLNCIDREISCLAKYISKYPDLETKECKKTVKQSITLRSKLESEKVEIDKRLTEIDCERSLSGLTQMLIA